MAQSVLNYFVRRLVAGAAPANSGRSDADLLRAFAATQDQTAFTELLRRYGRLVWAICLRQLRNEQDAEDAFQATFIVLARKAGSLHCRGTLANWMYGVADRTARAARRRAAIRQRDPQQADRLVADPAELANSRELCDAILDEVGRLPERYRAPLVLCGLEGRTKPEAARALGWKEGTVSGRLARARVLLQRRLTRRGIMSDGSALVVLPAVPATLNAEVLRAVFEISSGSSAASSAFQISQEVFSAMTTNRLRVGAICLATLVAAGVGGYAALRSLWAAAPDDLPKPPVAVAPGQATWQEAARILGQDAYVSLSPDERVLATFDDSGDKAQIIFWDTESWKERARYVIGPQLGAGRMDYLPFSATGKTAAFIDWSQTLGKRNPERHINLIDPATGKERGRLPGFDMIFGPAGQILAVRSGDDVVVHNLDTGTQISVHAGRLLKTHANPIVFSRDGTLVYAASGDGGKLFEAATGKVRATLAGYYPQFSPDGRTLATYCLGPEVKLWDTADGKLKTTIHGFAAPDCVFEFSPDGKTLLTSGNDILRYKPDGELDFKEMNKPKKALTTDLDVRLWDVATGKELARLPGRIRLHRSGRFDQDGRTIIYQRLSGRDQDMEVVLWDVASKKERMVLRQPGGIESVLFTQDGSMMVAMNGYLGGPLRVWNLGTGHELPGPATSNGGQNGRFISGRSTDGRMFVEAEALPAKVGDSPKYNLRVLRFTAEPLTAVVRGAATPPSRPEPEMPKVLTPAGRDWEALNADSAAADRDFGRDLQSAKTDEEKKDVSAKRLAAVERFAGRAIEIARKYPADPAAVEALAFALRFTSAGTEGKMAELGRSAVELAKQNYLTSDQLGKLVQWLTHQQRQDADDLLQVAFEKSPNRTVRGRAGFWLGYSLTEQAEAARLLRQMPEIAEMVKERPAAVARLRATDPEAVERRAELLYESLQKDYADVPEQEERADLIGPAAERALFALRNLAVGKMAPEIEGKDLDGKPLKLSDYRGKVVVVLFCGDWCGPCKAMKPQLRRMVKALAGKPFELLEINSDDDPGGVKDRRVADGNTWPCVPDGGREGPIHHRWNVTRFPTVFVLDEKGVIRFKELRDEPLQNAVEQLLKK